MPTKRALLEALTRPELQAIADQYQLNKACSALEDANTRNLTLHGREKNLSLDERGWQMAERDVYGQFMSRSP